MEKRQKNGRLRARIGITVGLVVLILLAVINAVYPLKFLFAKSDIPPRGEGEMRVRYLSVGEADCVIVELPNGETMLVDGGDGSADSEWKLVATLRGIGAKKIERLVVTSAKKGKQGSLSSVVKLFGVEHAYFPETATIASPTEYAELYTAVQKSATTAKVAARCDRFTGGDAECVFLSPDRTKKGDTLSFRLEYAGVGFYFGGETTAESQDALVAEYEVDNMAFNRDVHLKDTAFALIAGHGGTEYVSEEFLSYLHVQTAILSVGGGKLPTREGLYEANRGVGDGRVLRTDERGDIVVTVNRNGTTTITYEKQTNEV